MEVLCQRDSSAAQWQAGICQMMPQHGEMARRLGRGGSAHLWAVPRYLYPILLAPPEEAGGMHPELGSYWSGVGSGGSIQRLLTLVGGEVAPAASDLTAPRPHHPHSVCSPLPAAEVLSEHPQLSKEALRVLKVEAQPVHCLEEVHLLSAAVCTWVKPGDKTWLRLAPLGDAVGSGCSRCPV